MKKLLLFAAVLLGGTLLTSLEAVRGDKGGAYARQNHSTHYFKQIRQLSKMQPQQVPSRKAFLFDPCPITEKQLYHFWKMKDCVGANSIDSTYTNQSSQGSSRPYFGNPVGLNPAPGLNPVLTFLLWTMLLTDQASACGRLKPMCKCIQKSVAIGTGGVGVLGAGALAIWRAHPFVLKKVLNQQRSVKKVVKILGYDPQFSAYAIEDVNFINPSPLLKSELITKIRKNATAILTAHGFGDNNLAGHILREGNFISVGANFRDAAKLLPMGLRFTNLGQAPDASVLLYELVKCHRLGAKRIIGFGHSRGGAAFITLLHMLTFPDRYKTYFRAMGLENSDGTLKMYAIEQLKRMLYHLILAHPLVSIPSTLKHVHGPLRFLTISLLTVVADYNPFEKTQLAMLEEIYMSNQGPLPPLTISLCPRDEVVGTVHNKDLQKIAAKSKGRITVKIEGRGCGHNYLYQAEQILDELAV